jgi:peptidylprolyl isomerase
MLMRRNVPVVLALLLAIALVWCAGCKQPSAEQPQPTAPATTAAPTTAPAETTPPEQKSPATTPAKPETKPAAEKPAAEAKPEGKAVTTSSGLKYIDVKVGTGATPKNGQVVSVHYTGWLKDGTKFDSSRDRGQPFEFTLGAHEVIPGWDEGVATMKIGGRRTLIVPPKLGYGEQGTPGGPIPANAELKFDVELLGVK